MKVIDLFKPGYQTISFEFFPPKTLEQEANLFKVLGELKKFDPDFVSVTYGAMGTTREKTFKWVKMIKEEFGIEPVVHLTCIAATKDSIKSQLDELSAMEVFNILALRGDPPEGDDSFEPPKNGFKYAKDLVLFIKNHHPEFCVGVAGFPEGHISTKDLTLDIKYLKEKIEAGAQYIVTQMFFDNRYFFDFVEQCKKAGINIPIVPGIMPITNLKQVKKITSICGATIPQEELNQLEEYADDQCAVEKFGIDRAVKQCKELLESKACGIHFFVMNQSGPISKIISNLTR
ncbi:methylenetetrahydrofolate reductase [NAD(P)H] [Candidatus Saganbacteria bacterium]|nr:methylenetetrahydrofolate reductase [NAD(P)H] [Candidatus Saganbacteria bacterium]